MEEWEIVDRSSEIAEKDKPVQSPVVEEDTNQNQAQKD